MKKKIVSLILLAVAFTAVTVTVVSCKDSDFEYQMQQQLDENSTLDEALKAQVTTLEQLLQSVQNEQGVMQSVIDALQAVVDANTLAIAANQEAIDAATDAIKANTDAIAANSELITQLGQQIDINSAAIESNTEAIAQNAEAIADAQTNIATAQAAIGVLEDAMNEINEALEANGFESMNDMAAEVVGIMQAYDDLKDQVLKNMGDISDLQTIVSNMDVSIGLMQGDISDLQDAKDKLQSAVDDLEDSMSDLQDDVSGLTTTVETLSDQLVEYGEILADHSTTITQLLIDTKYATELAEANEERIEILESSLQTVSDDLDQVKGDLQVAQTNISNIQTDVADIEQRLSAVESSLAEAQDNIQSIQDDLLQVQKDLEDVKDDIEEIKQQAIENLATAEAYADSILAALVGDDFRYGTLGEFQDLVLKLFDESDEQINALSRDLTELANKVDALNTELTELTETIDEILDRLDYLDDYIKAIANYLGKQVTSILVQATVNPVFGTFSMPMSINSNVLAAFYGKVTDEDLVFPTASQKYYANVDEGPFLTSADLQMLGVSEQALDIVGDGYIFNEKEGNAGTLYVTVNPNTVNFEGLEFGMENSVQEESKVQLGELEKSDYKITFGYTRADASNGFYEAPATLKAENINENIDMSVAVEDLKNLMNDLTDYIKGNSLNMTDILTSMYQDMTAVLDADAIYAEWEDTLGDKHRTYSQYCIGATAVKPLSYAFMGDVNYETFPGIGRIENIIDKLFESIDIPTFDLSQYVLSEIEHISNDDELISFDAKIRVSSAGLTPGETIYIYASNGSVIGSGTWDGVSSYVDISITLEIPQSEIYDEPISDINSVIDAINNALDDINSVLADLDKINNISSAIDDLEAQLIHYVDRINDMLCNMINSVNSTLQPILLVNTTDGFNKLSQMRSSPSVLSSGNDIQLLPTSFTDEILAPAYKKLVGVTNVYSISDLSVNAQDGDSTCKSLLDAANNSNSELASVIDGDVRRLSISGLQAGYIYEIVYSAVDYSGKVVAEKFYVRVAE